MKIAILGATNIKHMSLISHYLDNIDLSTHEIDIIHVDKYGINELIDNVGVHKFPIKINRDYTKFKKLKLYFKFKIFAEKLIKEKRYDLIIVWGTYTGHLFKNFLIKNYKKKYILNVRDYFYESNKIVFKRMKALVDNSILTTLSSDGFLEFLPYSKNYYIIYSFNESMLKNSETRNKLKIDGPLRISFIGNNRFYEVNKKFMISLKNDDRFILQYFGTGSNVLRDFALKNNINNTKFIDGFPIEKTAELLNETDILNNVYGNNDIALDTALSIRLYYAIYLNKPILTSENTFTSKKAKELKLGLDINIKQHVSYGDEIINWYRNLNLKKINELTNKELVRISNVNNFFYKKLRKIIENEDI
ncbi:capsular biosynthesis protein [Staphylococcus saprophyticus]|uniref:capsular biosynthesis protein n=1 Tax=Staphylococcus saprophyticus TaxID=29385 RepID=UPI0029774D95|nr:capsular biosynthesis protein [Staphylococcus saprophyticus]